MTDITPASANPPPTAASAPEVTPFRRFANEFLESRLATIGLGMTVTICLAALLAPLIAPYDMLQIDILDQLLPPGSKAYTGGTYVLGTDDQGRDMVSAILYGLRISIAVGMGSAFLAMLAGTSIGLFAAFFGGRIDAFIMRVVDIQISFPTILIALILLAVLGKGVDKVVLALVIVQWAYYARTVRGQALVETGREYVEAGRCLALSQPRLIFRHILPNCMPPLIVVVTVQVANAIALEATLSFLGLGLPVTEPSLGLLISNGYDYLLGGKYWISVLPGVALLITIVSINLVGDQLREVLNPRTDR
jgi:peptide/nickel transport system permease protein